MNTITISGAGFSFSAQFELLSPCRAQDIAFDAVSQLVHEEQLLRARDGARFDVVLRGYAEGCKISMIKEIRHFAGIGLKESKDLSEALPAAVVQQKTAKEATQIAKSFEQAGGDVEIVPSFKE